MALIKHKYICSHLRAYVERCILSSMFVKLQNLDMCIPLGNFDLSLRQILSSIFC